jgi:glycerol uptake facilitator-like aquaporin
MRTFTAEEPCRGFGPNLVGCLVWAIGLSLGGTTGYAIDPARDLGPRIAPAVLPIAGKGNSDWSYAAIPIVGPLVGASLAGLLLHIFEFLILPRQEICYEYLERFTRLL